MKLCLKHLRQKNLSDVFSVLQERTQIKLEHDLLTTLFDLIVQRGDFEEAEKLLERSASSDLFHEYISLQPYTPKWKRLYFSDGIFACSLFQLITFSQML